ncbi:hypothetical protein K439DRAFT_1203214 [Ramaria rubella]|nr:hypothetical protein K439DRAFT_1203214 [Ramaria rubella]
MSRSVASTIDTMQPDPLPSEENDESYCDSCCSSSERRIRCYTKICKSGLAAKTVVLGDRISHPGTLVSAAAAKLFVEPKILRCRRPFRLQWLCAKRLLICASMVELLSSRVDLWLMSHLGMCPLLVIPSLKMPSRRERSPIWLFSNLGLKTQLSFCLVW